MFKDVNAAFGFIKKTSWMGAKLDLSRITKLCALLGNPQKKLRFVHIAGTNGKGSTSAMISSVLVQAGYKTGLYTSPELVCFGERMQVNGVSANNEEIMSLAWEVKTASQQMADPPTEFEVITAMAFLHFVKNKCGIVVLEVGMGGRLDATNVIDAPFVSVITSIGLDHTEFLGDTPEKIAAEKAGIIKPGTVVVSHPQLGKVEEVIVRKCQNESVGVKFVDLRGVRPVMADLDGQVFMYSPHVSQNGSPLYNGRQRTALCPPHRRLPQKGKPKDQMQEVPFRSTSCAEYGIPLLGEHQLLNAAVSIEVVFALQNMGFKITHDDLCLGLMKTKWPGRFDVLRKEPPFILDVAHNPAGIETAVKTLLSLFPKEKFVFLMGALKDKDYVGMVKKIIPHALEIIFVPTEGERGLTSGELAATASNLGSQAISAESIEAGVKTATELSQGGGVVCALGSFAIAPCVMRLVSR